MELELSVDPKAKGLIFDVDGTICDTIPIHFIAYRETAKKYGFEMTPDDFHKVNGIPAIQTSYLLKDLFNKDFDPVEFANAKEECYVANMHLAKPIGPVVKIIRENKGKLPMACGTGGTKLLALKTLEIAGVRDCFEHVVAAEDVVNHKPHPDTFLKAAELIGVNPTDCQVFEDSRLGLQAAMTAGMIPTDVTPFYQAFDKK
jgi:beta-phosphoglucomutase-like phosphatase (HAD superfamily)